LTRIFIETVSRVYGKGSGAVVSLQRASSDMRLNPHVHAVFLDVHYVERGEEFEARSRVTTSDVAALLERTLDKMFAYLRRRKMLALGDEADEANDEDEDVDRESSRGV